MFFLQVFLGNRDEGCNVVRVRVRSERRRVGATFKSYASSEFSVQELFVDGLLAIEVVVLKV